MSDYISRQAVLDKAYELDLSDTGNDIRVWVVDVAEVKKLPTAQPEVIRCKDCKWKQGSECVRFADARPFPDDYCSRAERKEA